MSHLIEVEFKGNRREFFLWETDELPPLKAPLIVEVDRGEDLGHVHSVGELAERRCTGCAHGTGSAPPTRKARRLATPEEVARHAELRQQDDVARRRAAERVRANNLVMKLTDAEWQWDRKKLTFYFTAERRVDFRNLVRELASMFRARIEMRQIGVRDEAKRLGGVGRCGREYCSASWLPELRPVNLGVAKDQRLSLNPSQISGACGRLMCCLRYEHEFYVQSRKRFPKEGKVLVTARGEEKVVANDIFNDRVTLRTVDGESRVVVLAELKRELARASADPGAATEEEPPTDAETVSEEASETDEMAPDAEAPVHGRRSTPRAGRPPQGPRKEDRPREPRQPQQPQQRPQGALRSNTSDVKDAEAPPAPSAAQPEAAPESQDARPARPGAARRRGRRGGRRGRGGAPRPDGTNQTRPGPSADSGDQ